MAVNKVTLGDETLIDLSNDTAEAEDVLEGAYFHTAAGVRTAGTRRNVVVDDELSSTSENPVQNKVIYEALQNIHIDVDDELSDSSENPVQNKVITQELADQKSAIAQYIGTPDLKTKGYILNDGKLHTDGGANDRYSEFIQVKAGNTIEVFARGNANTNALSFYSEANESAYVEGIANNRATHFTYDVVNDGWVRFYFTVSEEQLYTTSVVIYSNADVYTNEVSDLNTIGKDVLPYMFRYGFWQNKVYYFDQTHYCSDALLTVNNPIYIYAKENLRCDWDLMENGSYVRTYRFTSETSPAMIPAGEYYVNVTKTNGENVTIDDIRYGMTVKTQIGARVDTLESNQSELRFNEMFSRQAALSLGNEPTFKVSGTDITLTFDGNMFVTKKASPNALYAFSNLGGSYTVPASNYCVVNISTGEIQILTSEQLFAATDDFAILFFNHYGYPKFGWEMYWNAQKSKSEMFNNLTAHPYSGEKISISETMLTYDKIMSLDKGYSQGGACFGNYLFQFHSQNQLPDADFHGCTIANLNTKEIVQFIDLGYDENIHNNNASFGTIKYDAADQFPLLFVSQENANARKCLVYRITSTGNTSAPFSFTLVQEINFPTVAEWNVVYPNACIGDDGYLYILGYISNNEYEILKYNCPQASNSVVQLTYSDAISSANLTIDTNAQGFMVFGGKLYITAGASSYSIMQVHNLGNGSQLSKVNFNNIGLPYEPEAIFLYNNTLCVTFAINACTVYRFNF